MSLIIKAPKYNDIFLDLLQLGPISKPLCKFMTSQHAISIIQPDNWRCHLSNNDHLRQTLKNLPFSNSHLIPMKAGETISWQIQ